MFDLKKLSPFHQSKAVTKPRSPKKKSLTKEVFNKIIKEKVPEAALEYCTALWTENPFSFSITKTRSTCLGNYKFQNGHHTITVNHDLNIFNFLITFIHEVAHQHVSLHYIKKKPAPHGKEWKSVFQRLMAPLLNETVFPKEILVYLVKHMSNPAASSTRDAQLMRALKSFDSEDKKEAIYLENIKNGESFIFKNRRFQKVEKRRTRVLCKDLDSNKKYTIPLMAEIKLL